MEKKSVWNGIKYGKKISMEWNGKFLVWNGRNFAE